MNLFPLTCPLSALTEMAGERRRTRRTDSDSGIQASFALALDEKPGFGELQRFACIRRGRAGNCLLPRMAEGAARIAFCGSVVQVQWARDRKQQ